ncbi:ATP-binding cassette domain-containing protein [Erysipelothrix urinaevulpis]|uniref:ATP-binding cassette domain-containing protein n=1 Tax=Erysipelothrix urinaevulpis TaxID=2683717 RepID=UPI00135B1394|nr:ATP-binding cassette domain-containing protein [Erysipelothrix urinaevulpis]
MNDLVVSNVSKSYGSHCVLKDINLSINNQEITLLMGPSGCGKSTLLNIIGLLDTYDSGEVKLFGTVAPKPFTPKAVKLLRDRIGYLFQNFALVEQKSVEYNLRIALENVKGNKKQQISDALKKVGLENFEKKKIYECSGGEQQRVAIARLLLKPCDLVLCDEPTGSLDGQNKELVMELLLLLKAQGKTIMIVTHDDDLKRIADSVVYMDKE